MHYYKRNLGDYYKKAGRLSIIQHGVYNLLIDACYDRESFPTRDQAIDWVWASSKEEIEAVEYILDRFFCAGEDGVYIQKRIAEELEDYASFKEKQKENGRKGGRPKNPVGLNKNPDVKNKTQWKPRPSVSKPKKSLTTNQEPLTTNQEPITPLSTGVDIAGNLFDYWVQVMGKHEGSTKFTAKRKKCVRARLKEGYTSQQIRQAIDNCRNDPFSMGKNDRQAPFNDLELICRTGEKLEFFINKSEVLAIEATPDYSAIAREHVEL